MATRIFTDEELEGSQSFPAIGKDELIRYFTLTPADEAFLRKFRRAQNVLGAAVQLSALPWLGVVPDNVHAAPPAAVGRLARQLGLAVADLSGYGEREQTPHGPSAGDRRVSGVEAGEGHLAQGAG
ncbi:DUF4158 domain-containing protein [Streptomyces sp. SPB162]|uniref:DUF4158 domain-containing protein n=1 Tax=Streptomyces sp. SPB162 TaxID=2940560 RepID=UPI0024059F0D|nr:DUF4158 domain-containing protein [Streptomyces sp. SPB162]MDF9816681.1 hypothetical protein [Streptomyces sp. SPB162]